MSTFDDPNREAVGLEPIWSGAGQGSKRKRGTMSTQTPEPGQPRPDQPQPEPDEPDEPEQPGRRRQS